jgi:hypothetical protein
VSRAQQAMSVRARRPAARDVWLLARPPHAEASAGESTAHAVIVRTTVLHRAGARGGNSRAWAVLFSLVGLPAQEGRCAFAFDGANSSPESAGSGEDERVRAVSPRNLFRRCALFSPPR